MSIQNVDVVIIGGGVSGLTAAYRLLQMNADIRIAVLEAKDRLGGRTLSVPMKSSLDGKQETWDMGGQWVGWNQVHVKKLLEELDIGMVQYCSDRNSDLAMLTENDNGHISRSTLTKPNLSLIDLMEMYLLRSEINMISQLVNFYDVRTSSFSKEMDALSIQGFLDQRKVCPALSDMLVTVCRVMFGLDPINVSFLHFAHLVKCAGSLENLTLFDKTSAQGFVIDGGAQAISEKLSNAIGRDRIFKLQPVISIKLQENTDSAYTIETADGSRYTCDYVIIATPPNMTAKISFQPQLPVDKMQTILRLVPGYIIKTVITYAQSFWEEDGLSGEIMTTGHARDGPISMCFTGSRVDRHGHALVVFIGGDQAVRWSKEDVHVRQEAIVAELSRFFGKQASNYLEYREFDWYREPYNECSPVCCPSPGSLMYHSLNAPVHNIFFAGSETAEEWCGFISGAVQAGARAASQVLHKRHGKDHQKEVIDTFNLPEGAPVVPWTVNATVYLITASWSLVRGLRLCKSIWCHVVHKIRLW